MKKLAILLFVIGCSGKEVVRPHPTPVVTDTEYCEKAEQNLLKLGCDEGKPTKKGKSFTQFCKETQSNGIFINPKCLATINTCEVDSCTIK